MGTHQVALLAQAYSVPFHVAVESYKFVRSFPLGTGASDLARIGVQQNLLRLEGGISGLEPLKSGKQNGRNEREQKEITHEEEMIEITPSNLITALITENGIVTPAGVSEELIKLWF